MANRETVALTIAGQTYRVQATAPEDVLRRLAVLVDKRIHALVPPGKPIPATAILLVALALAHDLEEEKAKRLKIETMSRDMLLRMLSHIDLALEDGSSADSVE